MTKPSTVPSTVSRVVAIFKEVLVISETKTTTSRSNGVVRR